MLNKIHKGDTLSVLKSFNDEFIDLSITSPPYNKRITSSGKNSIMKPIEYDSVSDNLPENEYQYNQIKVMDEIYRTTKPGGSFFYNHKVRHLKGVTTHPMEWITKTQWHLKQEIIWDRSAPVEVGGYRFYQVDERIYWLYKPISYKKLVGPRMKSKHARCSSIWRFTPDRKNSHPAPFPLDLPLRCILSVLDEENGTVFDPYMGSGTTAVAAKLLNKDYIGIDISDNYIKDAYQRINNFESERFKLDKELKNHFVKQSYKERKAKNLTINDF